MAKPPEAAQNPTKPYVMLTVEEITSPERLALTGRQTVTLELLLAHSIREQTKQAWTLDRDGEVFISVEDVAALMECDVSRVYEHIRVLVDAGFCIRADGRLYVRKLPGIQNSRFDGSAATGTDEGEHQPSRRKPPRTEAETTTARGENHHTSRRKPPQPVVKTTTADSAESGLGTRWGHQEPFPGVLQ